MNIENPQGLLANIARMLDGQEWNADTCNGIAEELRSYGYVIREPKETEDDDVGLPWCEDCRCYHSDKAEHIRDVRKRIYRENRRARIGSHFWLGLLLVLGLASVAAAIIAAWEAMPP